MGISNVVLVVQDHITLRIVDSPRYHSIESIVEELNRKFAMCDPSVRLCDLRAEEVIANY